MHPNHKKLQQRNAQKKILECFLKQDAKNLGKLE